MGPAGCRSPPLSPGTSTVDYWPSAGPSRSSFPITPVNHEVLDRCCHWNRLRGSGCPGLHELGRELAGRKPGSGFLVGGHRIHPDRGRNGCGGGKLAPHATGGRLTPSSPVPTEPIRLFSPDSGNGCADRMRRAVSHTMKRGSTHVVSPASLQDRVHRQELCGSCCGAGQRGPV